MSSTKPVPFFKRRFVRARMGTHAYLMRRVDDSVGPISVEQSVECLGPLLVENLSRSGIGAALNEERQLFPYPLNLKLRLTYLSVVKNPSDDFCICQPKFEVRGLNGLMSREQSI